MSERKQPSSFALGALALVSLQAFCAAANEPPVTDPTRAPITATPANAVAVGTVTGLRLYSTRVSDAGWVAMINDRIVGVGSRIGGAEVVEISPGRVRLRQGENTFTLRLDWPSVKRPAVSGE